MPPSTGACICLRQLAASRLGHEKGNEAARISTQNDCVIGMMAMRGSCLILSLTILGIVLLDSIFACCRTPPAAELVIYTKIHIKKLGHGLLAFVTQTHVHNRQMHACLQHLHIWSLLT